MNKYMISSMALRMTFLVIAVIIYFGVWLTGFSTVH